MNRRRTSCQIRYLPVLAGWHSRRDGKTGKGEDVGPTSYYFRMNPVFETAPVNTTG